MDTNDQTDRLATGVAEREIESRIQQLLTEIQDSSTSVDVLVDSISAIPGLTDKLINRVNSPEFALHNQILRLQHAIAYLGLRRVEKTVAMFHAGSKKPMPAPHMLRNANKQRQIKDSKSV